MKAPVSGRGPKLAHVVSRFPKLSETFILYELLQQERLGIEIVLYSLIRHNDPVVHPDVRKLAGRVCYRPFLSLPILRAVGHYARRCPRRLLGVVREVLGGTLGSPKFFIRALIIFPKSVRFALDMERDGVTHVHAHFATHSTVAALIVHRLTGIPFSFTARGSDIHVNRCMLRHKVEAAALVIAVSEYNKTVIVEECGAEASEKVHVIYGGIDTEVFAPRPSRDRNGTFTIVCVSSFEEVKGHTYLVDACRILVDRGVKLECHLVGGGPLQDRIARQIESAGLHGIVRIHGARTQSDVVEHLATADVFALATAPTSTGRQEGIPNVLKEAMACGLPVVACRAGGIPELVEDGRTGILVRPRDTVALADALQHFASDPDSRRRLGAAGRERIVREFNLSDSASRRAALFLGAQRDD